MNDLEQLTQEQTFLDAALSYDLRIIRDETRFWMIRTKKGYFYNEFISNDFVAPAWNTITSAADFSEANQEALKDQVLLDYEEVKRPATVINKCDSFIHDVKPGDYIVIPSAGSERITIALAGEYYEEEYLQIKSAGESLLEAPADNENEPDELIEEDTAEEEITN